LPARGQKTGSGTSGFSGLLQMRKVCRFYLLVKPATAGVQLLCCVINFREVVRLRGVPPDLHTGLREGLSCGRFPSFSIHSPLHFHPILSTESSSLRAVSAFHTGTSYLFIPLFTGCAWVSQPQVTPSDGCTPQPLNFPFKSVCLYSKQSKGLHSSSHTALKHLLVPK
jgi:hypothetical protein